MTSQQVIVNGVDVADLLVRCQMPQTRVEAEKQLELLQSGYPFQLFPGLAVILAGEDKQPVARQLAGLVLKNAFAGKEGARGRECKERWMALSQAGEPGRVIKQGILTTLTQARDQVARRTAAQVISAISAIELPLGQWTDLIDPILMSCVAGDKDTLTRQSALVCLAYMCEEFSSRNLEIPQLQVNSMLTAIIQGMKDPEHAVKKEAAKALFYAVVLARANFENQPERDVIVHTICQCVGEGTGPSASRPQIDVCLAACECLVQIASEFYYDLAKYMNAIGPLTFELMKQTLHENLAMCAIEFWSTVCEEESSIQILMETEGPESVQPSCNLAKQALSLLIPILTQTMVQGNTGDDDSEDADDSWNTGMAAASCLALVAGATLDDCVDPVLQFVNQSFQSRETKHREAAMLAYGSILDGPSPVKMAPIIQQSLQVIVSALNDPSLAVRDNAAWTVGRICQFHSRAIAPAVPNLVPVLLQKLGSDKPRVAEKIAWTLDVLGQEEKDEPCLNLAPFFTQIVGGLLTACMRADAHVRNLRMTGYAAVSSLASNAGRESSDALVALLDELTGRLEASMTAYAPMLQLPAGQALADEMRSAIQSLPQADRDCELQGYICGCLQTVCNRLRGIVDLTPRAERLMTLYMHVFTLYQRMQGSAAAIHEDALLASSALASNLGQKFEVFLPVYLPVVLTAVANYESYDVCSMAVRIVGDIARAVNGAMDPFCDELVRETLAPILERRDIDKRLKPLVMATLGDLALATRGRFEPYVPGTVKLLSQAAFTRLEDGPVDSEEWIDYLNQLRASVLSAYSDLLYGLKDAGRQAVLKDSVQSILEFVVRLTEDKSVSEDVLSSAVGLVGDLVGCFQADLARLIKGAPFVQRLVQFAAGSQNETTQESGRWLARAIDRFAA
jgi:importin subunit beta-1